jgi:hypothetical protein
MSTTTLRHLLPINHIDFMDKNRTFSLWTCTGQVISHDVYGRFWSSIACSSHQYIWSTTSNVNYHAPTLASHQSYWLYDYFCRNFMKNSILKVMVCEYEGSDCRGQCLGWCICMWVIALHADMEGVGTLRGLLWSRTCVFCTFSQNVPIFDPKNRWRIGKIDVLPGSKVSDCRSSIVLDLA